MVLRWDGVLVKYSEECQTEANFRSSPIHISPPASAALPGAPLSPFFSSTVPGKCQGLGQSSNCSRIIIYYSS